MARRIKTVASNFLMAMIIPLFMLVFLTGYQDGTPFCNTLGIISRYLIFINIIILEILERKKLDEKFIRN
ncbi:MAG: hypothetical protein Q4C64_08205 [Erysipelotrichia bacterium]|nr:hypothetical protein [Erysipelotrichia bacterium]